MKPSIQTLGQILYSPSQYAIPVFQRNYRWEQPQWDKLWNSVIEIQRPEKHGNHFMGFLVFVPGLAQPGQHTTFHLIDGQQRLTTSSLMLAAIRNVARSMGQVDLADEIHQYFLVHPLKKGEQHYRLLPKERDHDSYVAIVNGEPDPKGRTAEALEYFEEAISAFAAGASEPLRQLFDTVNQRLEFMCATLEAENAYNIFKSLNSTGVPLGPSDLIRNFVFLHVAPDDQDEFDRELWGPLEEKFVAADGTLEDEQFSKFFRDYLMSGGRYVSPKETFSNFEERYEATDFSPQGLARALLASVEDYAVITAGKSDLDPNVTSALRELNLLESSTTYPLLLALFEKRRTGVIDNGSLVRAVEMLRGFILRRFICAESSRAYGRMFVRALIKDKGAPVETLETYLLDRGWPDDNQFETAFVDFPLYVRGYTHEVLATLERARGHKEPADLSATQVEHIMPQTLSNQWRSALGAEADRLHATWVHKPGNLTLSGYNLELWNHPFAVKRERYAQSNVVITRELAANEHWTDSEILKRGQQLAKEAARIWIGPKVQPPRAEAERTDTQAGPGRDELRQLFWGGLAEHLLVEHPELPLFEVRPSWAIRLPSGIRNIGVEIKFGLKYHEAAIEVWFWTETSFPLWERIRNAPDEYNSLISGKWQFAQVSGRSRGRMYLINSSNDLYSESSWPEVYLWFGENLSLLYSSVISQLRQEMDGTEVPA